MNTAASLDYLEQFVFCGLCFQKMALKNGQFLCPSGCKNDLSAPVLEELVWNELGKLLSVNSFRDSAQKKLREKLSSPQVKHLFHDLQGFVEFLPTEEKLKFTTALLEKVDVLTSETVKIQFRN